ncbi:hypothetical protein [Microbacterium sp. ER1]|uniref:hypothetical protein n=1 Tax=unclassified Microbacterium TaxID=2609290 RepID=UPI00201AECD8|nr:hypothetical protein [Microbacterium sp. ER1]
MDYERFDGADGLEIRVPKNEGYRTCAECGADCLPEPTDIEGAGIRIAFVCPDHGVHSFIDPFEGRR